MQVSKQIVELLVTQRIAEAGHHVSPAQDDGGDTLVIRGGAARQIFLLIKSLQARSMQRVVTVRVMAAGAVRHVDLVSRGFLRSEFIQRL